MRFRSCLFLAAALVAAAAPASAGRIGIGAFGGLSHPIFQDDTASGPQFGLRVPVNLLRLVTVEPYYAKTSGADKDQAVLGATYTRSGIDVTSFGANLLVPFGGTFQFYPYAGIGSNKLERTGLDATTTGYTFGIGLALKMPTVPVAVHLRSGLNAVLDEGSSETSRKWVDVSIGATYDLFNFMPN